ncbi:hypothetical protein [Actinoplanes rectilineatus]|uniref:hypothetical protein n=1 Tax=Actinoplanes rectilineatus TaxID=113571 RepID=UPI0005F2A88E|nr:hypothetical protein [Actinoplanes rectilineatus]
MNYDLLTVGETDPDDLRAALAELFSVPETEVDVSPEDSETTNWEAAVLCAYKPVHGDVTLSLDIYIRGTGPEVSTAAAHLAGALGVLVLYASQPFPPSAYWLVEPHGRRTRARVYEMDEGDLPHLVIDAVAGPVAALPTVDVKRQPEVIREHQLPLPVTEELRTSLADAHPEQAENLRHLLSSLGGWESMVARMTAGWPPDGWYPRDYFEDDLWARDEVATSMASLPGDVRDRVAAALARIDDVYWASTSEVADSPEDPRWWRRRVPDPVPWPGDAAR